VIGDYGALPAAKIQQFTATAVLKEDTEVAVWTDGVLLTTDESAEERRAGFRPAFRLIAGKQYRVTVEEIS
jgi:hypothetical protein